MSTFIMIYLTIWITLQGGAFFVVRVLSEFVEKNKGDAYFSRTVARDKKTLRAWSWILLLAPAWPVLIMVGLFAGIKWLELNTEDTVKKAIKGVKQ